MTLENNTFELRIAILRIPLKEKTSHYWEEKAM